MYRSIGKMYLSAQSLIKSRYVSLSYAYVLYLSKGQLISKQNCRTLNSSKKQTKRTQDTILSAFYPQYSGFIRFLEEVLAGQFRFEIY